MAEVLRVSLLCWLSLMGEEPLSRGVEKDEWEARSGREDGLRIGREQKRASNRSRLLDASTREAVAQRHRLYCYNANYDNECLGRLSTSFGLQSDGRRDAFLCYVRWLPFIG